MSVSFRSHCCNLWFPLLTGFSIRISSSCAGAEASGSALNAKKRPGRLADMPAFYNVSIAELAPHRQGLMYLLEFDQPKLPQHLRSSKDPLLQVALFVCCF